MCKKLMTGTAEARTDTTGYPISKTPARWALLCKDAQLDYLHGYEVLLHLRLPLLEYDPESPPARSLAAALDAPLPSSRLLLD